MARQKKRLKKKLFYSGRPKPHFGLRNAQLRARNVTVIRNAGWYNQRGEKLGWGDLSMADLRRVAQSLRKGELFILLSETDAFWRFVTKYTGLSAAECEVKPEESAPGREYVATHCTHVVSPRRIHVVERWNDGRRPSRRTIDGVACRIIGQTEVDALMHRRPSVRTAP